MPLPYEIIETTGKGALAQLNALSHKGVQEGFTPVILGGKDDLKWAHQRFDNNSKNILGDLSYFSRQIGRAHV